MVFFLCSLLSVETNGIMNKGELIVSVLKEKQGAREQIRANCACAPGKTGARGTNKD